MGRTFSADIITLPRVDAHEAVTLASRLEAAAAAVEGAAKANPKAMAPPELVKASIADIGALRASLQKALGGQPATTSPTKKEADRRVDAAAVALHGILAAWAKVAESTPEGKGAQLVLSRVFDTGVGFVKETYDREWAQVDTKLKTIEAENLTPHIAAVGALPILDLLKEAHQVYGDVLGKNPLPPEVRKSRDALLDAMRRLVIRVAAHVEDDKPATVAFAEAMLKPIQEWESSKPAKPKGEDGDEPNG